ncbi:MAG: Ldh family oxidoreductase [Spirochaetia bacterium]|jgi:LDH2 family malate/lactate/ureidoglycolate dehydrogenase|nr:Ldh family oxidoreductase [Spirochaetia bacterium]
MSEITWWDFDSVEKYMKDGFTAIGVPEDEAAVCANVLITADKRGIDSHGVGRFKPIYLDRIWAGTQSPVSEIEIVNESETTAVIDGHNGMGHFISDTANKLAIEKAKKSGVGIVAVRNSTHYGAACYYPLKAIEQGCFGITCTNARPSIAPTWGIENMLGTNPLVFGFPTDEDFPFVLDCATSVTQRGKIELYERLGKDLPDGWVIGEDGKYRNDTKQVLVDLTKGKAALTPLGGLGELTAGYKGFGYAMVVEILSSALSDGDFLKNLSGKDKDGNNVPILLGHFFMAIDISRFIPLERFKKITGTICRDIRSSKKAEGQNRIWTPGEKEHDAWLERKDKGVPFEDSLKKSFREVKERLALPNTLPF